MSLKLPEHNANSTSQSSLEAGSDIVEKTTAQHLDLDKVGESQGYILDEATLKRQLGLGDGAKLKLAKDGKTVLIPQPSDDPCDPLNWPAWKKHLTLLVICIAGAMGDYASAVGAITLLPQAKSVLSLSGSSNIKNALSLACSPLLHPPFRTPRLSLGVLSLD